MSIVLPGEVVVEGYLENADAQPYTGGPRTEWFLQMDEPLFADEDTSQILGTAEITSMETLEHGTKLQILTHPKYGKAHILSFPDTGYGASQDLRNYQVQEEFGVTRVVINPGNNVIANAQFATALLEHTTNQLDMGQYALGLVIPTTGMLNPHSGSSFPVVSKLDRSFGGKKCANNFFIHPNAEFLAARIINATKYQNR